MKFVCSKWTPSIPLHYQIRIKGDIMHHTPSFFQNQFRCSSTNSLLSKKIEHRVLLMINLYLTSFRRNLWYDGDKKWMAEFAKLNVRVNFTLGVVHKWQFMSIFEPHPHIVMLSSNDFKYCRHTLIPSLRPRHHLCATP